MPIKRLRPVLAIAADLPLGRLLTSFRNKDRRTIPWIFSLFHALESQEDFDIHWITLSKAVSAAETIRMRNQTIHILPLGSMGKNILTAHFLTVRRIRKTLNDIQPDLLHVWGVEQAYALAGVAFRGKKLLSYQGALSAYCQRAPQAFLLHMQALWERMAVKHYDFITCESPWACDRVAEIAPHARLSCMEYGVEPSFYHLARKPSPEPSCLFAGTIYELKGISYLVEALRIRPFPMSSCSLRATEPSGKGWKPCPLPISTGWAAFPAQNFSSTSPRRGSWCIPPWGIAAPTS